MKGGLMLRKRQLLVMITLFFVVSGIGLCAYAAGDTVNINTATVEELCRLKRVGPKYAEAIIEYRKAHGDFKSPEDVMNVKGIGQKTFQENKDIIVVTDKKD